MMNKTIEEQIRDLSPVPLQIIQSHILHQAKEELNSSINFSNIKEYKMLIIKHTNNFINNHLKPSTSQNKQFKLF